MKRKPSVQIPSRLLHSGLQVPIAPAYNAPRAPAPLPAPPPLVVGSVGVGYEAFSWRGLWADLNLGGVQVPIYVTKERRTGIDVYVSTDVTSMPATAVMTVLIFAITQQGDRNLVATGRFGRFGVNDSLSNTTVGRPQLVAAVRADAERFEVVADYRDVGSVAPTGGSAGLVLTCIAADGLPAVPKEVGAIVVSGTEYNSIGAGTILENIELVGLSAVNNAAAARFLHVHFNEPTPNGDTPELVFPLGNAAGQGFCDYNIRARIPRTSAGPGTIAIVASSTPAVSTVVADCFITAWIR